MMEHINLVLDLLCQSLCSLLGSRTDSEFDCIPQILRVELLVRYWFWSSAGFTNHGSYQQIVNI